MTERNDHDILIAMETKLEMLIGTQTQYLNQYGKLLERVVAIEIQQGRNIAEVAAVKQDVDDLRKKSNVVDAINAAMAGVAGVVGFIFGHR